MQVDKKPCDKMTIAAYRYGNPEEIVDRMMAEEKAEARRQAKQQKYIMQKKLARPLKGVNLRCGTACQARKIKRKKGKP